MSQCTERISARIGLKHGDLMLMGFLDFLELVSKMREAQQKHALDPSEHNFLTVQELELKVDIAIREVKDDLREFPF